MHRASQLCPLRASISDAETNCVISQRSKSDLYRYDVEHYNVTPLNLDRSCSLASGIRGFVVEPAQARCLYEGILAGVFLSYSHADGR